MGILEPGHINAGEEARFREQRDVDGIDRWSCQPDPSTRILEEGVCDPMGRHVEAATEGEDNRRARFRHPQS